MKAQPPSKPKSPADARREAEEAAALRANLARRKQAARAKSTPAPAPQKDKPCP